MAEEEIEEKENNNNLDENINNSNEIGIEYLLFLILLLLLVGNHNVFSNYFELFNKQTSKMKNILETFSATAEGLKTAIITPQKMLDN